MDTMSFLLSAVFFFVNLAVCKGNRLVEDYERARGVFPPRGSVIEGTNQQFLYCNDFSTMTWGTMWDWG